MNVNARPFFYFAGFFRRAAAGFIDFFLLILLYFGYYHIGTNFPSASYFIFKTADVFFWLFSFLYFSGMEAKWGATIGKMIFRIKVVKNQGKEPHFLRSALRNALKVVSLAGLAIGYFLIFFTKNRQALHDIIAGCQVIKKVNGK